MTAIRRTNQVLIPPLQSTLSPPLAFEERPNFGWYWDNPSSGMGQTNLSGTPIHYQLPTTYQWIWGTDITPATTYASLASMFTLNRNSGGVSMLSLFRYGADANAALVTVNKTRDASGPSAGSGLVLNNDEIMRLVFCGSGGDGSYYRASQIVAALDDVPSATSMPGRLSFFVTPTSSTTPVEKVRIHNAGNMTVNGTTKVATLHVAGSFSMAAQTTKTGAYSLVEADAALVFNAAASATLTLQAAASYPGRILFVKTIAAQTVVSASANVIPRAGGAAGTAILAAGAGNWALLMSNGTNWEIIAGT